MTIHNFYLAAVCLIWAVILLVLYIRVSAARFLRFLRRWKKSRIALAFSPDCPRKKSSRICRRFYRYARDEYLFQYICDCYCMEIQDDSRRSGTFLDQCMKNILDRRISTLEDGNPIQRQLLRQSIRRTRLSSDKIDRFLDESSCVPFSSAAMARLKAAR